LDFGIAEVIFGDPNFGGFSADFKFADFEPACCFSFFAHPPFSLPVATLANTNLSYLGRTAFPTLFRYFYIWVTFVFRLDF
jgi:hypothetical protein